MCFQEYLAYQCGHSSFSVVRPCPMTTTGHNFPVCAEPPSKQHFAETMCAACERQLHSRWVLIREWEHRWMHERGACGCDVVFPGLLHIPRVTGAEAGSGAAERVQVSVGPKPAAAAANASDGRIPALFTEAVNSSGEHHVAVRLAGLYAAEWRDDHRAQHEAGKCTCRVDFAPLQPHIAHHELTLSERAMVREWELAVDKVDEKNDARDDDGQEHDDSTRIAEIERLFGKFTVGAGLPTVTLPRSPGAPVAGDKVAGRGRQGSTQGHGQPAGYITSSQQNPLNPQMPLAAVYGTPVFSPAPDPYTSYQPATINPAQIPTSPQHQQHPGYYCPGSSYGPYNPAHPAYATFATYTNTMPQGAYQWNSPGPSQQASNTPMTTQGPGPYRTPGLVFSTPPTAVLPHQLGGPIQVLPQEPPQPASPAPAALIGLPIGAGPEGTSHMPSWKQCRLRSASVDLDAHSDSESEMGGSHDGDGDGDSVRPHPTRRNSAPT
ncbi:hypothetical protein BT67DRAFT_85995 [Trichocladium antarcticum]|uniref:Uncharacterized protein n=1 Tax=Trichocladium antarcticum TaxID=1450529 RepID=A0AAN6UG01_9PEZI|nr:hypothetical protein BT67DRAFT_85995 [Trichocladium antarcticum]